jgi:uncharacterized protein YbjT (DUF2867 family)
MDTAIATSSQLDKRAILAMLQPVLPSAPDERTVLRAAVVLGSGSASFEMLRYLTERLPVMVTPSWVTTRTQPIAVRDVLRYLVGCADLPDAGNRAFDIGGPEVLTYAAMMRRYAAVARQPRRGMHAVHPVRRAQSDRWDLRRRRHHVHRSVQRDHQLG